ncbi:MAG: isoprenylcysteine carboxylmethyltransferase family protein [Eubacteriales bacterium]|nr:isoprenylcysteine carboxylmethyltransferase family protein [Eubacteriales bacterium]
MSQDDLKNEQKESLKQMSPWGIGPILIALLLVSTVLGLIFSTHSALVAGRVELAWPRILARTLSIVLILYALVLWTMGAFGARINAKAKAGELVTTGAYAWVRHPIYSAFFLVSAAVLIWPLNLYLLLLILFNWAFMSLILKFTEESTLRRLFPETYPDYCKRTNRLLAMPPRRQ